MSHCLVPITIDRNHRTVAGGYLSDLNRIIEGCAERGPPAMMAFHIEAIGSHRTFYLNDEIGEWLLERGITSRDCKLHWRSKHLMEGDWILSVPDHVAIMFKLTWGGA